MNTALNLAIASAYFLIPFLLAPLLQCTHKEIRSNLLVAAVVVFSCGISHVLQAFCHSIDLLDFD
jgi:L-lactate permease